MAATPTTPDFNNDLVAQGLAAQTGGPLAASGTINWGEGNGIDDIIRPENVDSLIDILESVEFEADIESDNYIKQSQLQSRTYLFDDDGDLLFQKEDHHHAK